MDVLILLAILGTVLIWIPFLITVIGSAYNGIFLYFLAIFGIFALLYGGVSRFEREREAKAKAKVYAKLAKLMAKENGDPLVQIDTSMMNWEEKPKAKANKMD